MAVVRPLLPDMQSHLGGWQSGGERGGEDPPQSLFFGMLRYCSVTARGENKEAAE